MTTYELDAETRVGFVALKVKNHRVVADWYQRVLGMSVLQQTASQTFLGTRANQQVLLMLSESVNMQSPTIGIDGVTIMLPRLREVRALYRHIKSLDIPVERPYQSGYGHGFFITDPEGHGLGIAHDIGSETQYLTNATWNQRVPELIDPVFFEKGREHFDTLPAGTAIGDIMIRVVDLDETLDYLTAKLGVTLRQVAGTNAYLTVGNPLHHFGITIIEDPAANRIEPNRSDPYVNLILPSTSTMDSVRFRLDTSPAAKYDYDETRHYLMATGPNHITIWFRVV